ncbi:hypothetical protein GCM10023185_26100 [Hymenobacter saemangeumensis]|uniref:CBM11 domain-containing protein n=1 Tax=Hymenobacter saemangeumensis TaxID=1084522 RepID=A0ABP8IIY3_9BACT
MRPIRNTLGVLPAVLLALTSCEPRDGRPDVQERPLLSLDFEQPARGMEVPAALTTAQAHSGKSSLRLDVAAHQNKAVYRTELGRLCAHRPRRFILGAWVWVPAFGDDASLVVSIDSAGKTPPAWQHTVYLSDIGPFGTWKHVRQAFDLPAQLSFKSQLTISFAGASPANGPAYADDLQLAELW